MSLGCLPDSLLVALGRRMTTVQDLDTFERAAGRPVPGLYPALFDRRLEVWLARPMNIHRDAWEAALPPVPDALMRWIVRDEGAPIFADAWQINSRPIWSWQDVDAVNLEYWQVVVQTEPTFKDLPVFKSVMRESERRDLLAIKELNFYIPAIFDEICSHQEKRPELLDAMRQNGVLKAKLDVFQQQLTRLEQDALAMAARYAWPEKIAETARGMAALLPPYETKLFDGSTIEDAMEAGLMICNRVFDLDCELDVVDKRDG